MKPDRSDAFVFFGATGDLAFKQISPALHGLIRDEVFELPIIGVARSGDLASLRARARQSLASNGAADPAATDKLLALLRYVKGSDDDADTFKALRSELGAAAHPLHYLAIPPALFGPVIGGLDQSGSGPRYHHHMRPDRCPHGRSFEGVRTQPHSVARLARSPWSRRPRVSVMPTRMCSRGTLQLKGAPREVSAALQGRRVEWCSA